MGDKKRSVIKKWKRTLIAAALTASVILALPVWNVGSAQAVPTPSAQERLVLKADGSIDDSTLTITRASDSVGDLEVDLYKVATALPVSGYDTYTLDLVSPFNKEEISVMLGDAMRMKVDQDGNLITDPRNENHINESYRRLAQKVAEEALRLKDETTGEGENAVVKKVLVNNPDYTIKLSEQPSKELEAGMYLVVPHGVGMKPAQYIDFIEANVADKEAPEYYKEAGQQIVTKAYNNGYAYTYLPELISLPMRSGSEEAEEGSFTTSATTLWQYNVRAELKSEQDVQMASLKISKSFTNTNDLPVLTDEATNAVFEIEAKIGNNVVYSNSVKISTNDDPKEVVLTDVIPVGATVTVEEVYAGAGYGVVGNKLWTETVEASSEPIELSASFTNNYNGKSIGGGIITNSFEPGEDGWKWYQDGVEKQPGSLQATGQ